MTEIELVIFLLEGERYGFDISAVREVVEVPPIMPVPETPDFVLGVVNLRGEILPVMDTKLRLGLEPTTIDRMSKLMIVEARGHRIGLLMESLPVVIRTDGDDIKSELSSIQPRIDAKFIAGEIEEEFLTILDSEELVLGGED